MNNENKIRKAIRKHLQECMDEISEQEMMMDEERIPNDTALPLVKNKENFIGSHCWAETFPNGDYVVVSYGQQFPIFIYSSKEKTWFENESDYIFNGERIEQTEEHKSILRPSVDVHLKPLDWMIEKLNSIKKKNGIRELSHTSVEPGTKN
jgi:hypothetical protein